MKTKAKVLSTQVGQGGSLLATVQFNERMPQKGSWINVSWGATRSNSQNALYWTYLTWVIEHGGLKDQGHFSPEALHLDLKTHFLSEKVFDKGQFKTIEGATTTDLNKSAFSDYFEKVDHFICDFFGISTQPFWDEHKERYEI